MVSRLDQGPRTSLEMPLCDVICQGLSAENHKEQRTGLTTFDLSLIVVAMMMGTSMQTSKVGLGSMLYIGGSISLVAPTTES